VAAVKAAPHELARNRPRWKQVAVQRKHIAPQSKTAQNANKNTPPRKKWL